MNLSEQPKEQHIRALSKQTIEEDSRANYELQSLTDRRDHIQLIQKKGNTTLYSKDFYQFRLCD
jgi:hypothetical protein